MKNYTVKERQEIYEYLLTLQAPYLLAALIAQRADKYYYSGGIKLLNEPLPIYISNNFIWEDTPEGQSFWEEIEAELSEMTLYRTPTLSDVIESTEQEMFDLVMKVHDADFEFHTEADFTHTEITPAKIEINADVSKFNQEMEKVHNEFYEDVQPLSFWAKVKLFFGRLSYGV